MRNSVGGVKSSTAPGRGGSGAWATAGASGAGGCGIGGGVGRACCTGGAGGGGTGVGGGGNGKACCTGGKAGCEGFDRIAAQRSLAVVAFDDWRRIDEAEVARARDGAPREKFVAVADMIAAARR